MKAIIAYKGKYGATSQYAHWLGEELQTPVIEAEDLSAEILSLYDEIIIGSSVYVGKLQVREWLKRNATLLESKRVFFFIVCATSPNEKQKVKEIIRNNIPDSLKNEKDIYFLPGRMIKKNLSWIDRFTLKMGAMLQKDPATRKAMLQDFDSVRREHLSPLIRSVQVPRRAIAPLLQL